MNHLNNVCNLLQCQNVIKNKFNYAYQQEFPYRTNHILECEFYLLENLDCCLIVYQPYRPLLPIIQDIGHEDQLLPLTWRIINDSLRTDVSLLYPPYMIAIGCLQLAWFVFIYFYDINYQLHDFFHSVLNSSVICFSPFQCYFTKRC